MKLRNKRTGEIGIINYFDNQSIVIYPIDKNWNAKGDKKYVYHSLTELNEEWEDYEEQKGNWTIDPRNENYIDDGRYTAPDELERYEELGLKFNTKEEAEKAVDKLKAWERLKNRGFRFDGYNACSVDYDIDEQYRKYISEDLDLLFGGEE